MKISVEISLYPLTAHFGTPILQFIERLKTHPELTVKSNTMSTQIFGEYEVVMDILKTEIGTAFLADETVVLVMKIVNADLR